MTSRDGTGRTNSGMFQDVATDDGQEYVLELLLVAARPGQARGHPIYGTIEPVSRDSYHSCYGNYVRPMPR